MSPKFTEEDLQEAADSAVKKVFAILGVDVDKPESVKEFQEDLRFSGRMRKAAWHGQLAVVAMFFTGLAYALWLGIASVISKLGGH